MKTRTKTLVGILVALVPAALATVAIKLEPPREFVKLGQEDPVEAASFEVLPEVIITPDRTFPEAVRYELGISPERVRKHRRHHRHHRHHYRAQNVSLAPGKVKQPAGPPPCVKRNGITICDPKADTRTPITRRPRRHRSWYLPERPTNELEPFGNE
jgi:hypothetical protein